MERNANAPEVYDFRQHDQIWKRVQPTLAPWPEPSHSDGRSSPQAIVPGAQAPSDGQRSLTLQQESQLPGAEPNPCCMGTEAAEALAVLEGYIENELEDRRGYLVLSRRAPSWARQALRELAEDEGSHARRLMAAYYLIQGRAYRPAQVCQLEMPLSWPEVLRRAYHEEVCGGMNYARTAESTTDVCLIRLLNGLSADEFRHADRLMALLERALAQPTC